MYNNLITKCSLRPGQNGIQNFLFRDQKHESAILDSGNSLPKKLLNFFDDFHQAIHLRFRIVEIKTRPRGGFHA